jgi:hypothetical protein
MRDGDERFNVVMWWPDGSHTYVERGLPAWQAVKLAKFITDHNPERKVMITDMGDYCCFLWECGKIVFPPALDN